MPLPAVQDPGRPTHLSGLSSPSGFPDPSAASSEDERASGSGSRPRVLLLGAAGAVVVILVAGGLAGGMFSYDKPSRNDTSAQDVRESVPAATTSASSPSPSSSPTASRSASPSPDRSLSAAPAAPSPTRTSARPSPTRSATPSSAPTTAQATGTITPAPGDDDKETDPVLRPGDEGDEVRELQLRLRQLGLYLSETDGVYDDSVKNAVTMYQSMRGIDEEEPGVYDRPTRERLESETTKP